MGAHPAFAATGPAAPPDWLRHAVRDVLQRSPGFHDMAPDKRRSLAQAMVKVSAIAAGLIAEEQQADQSVHHSGLGAAQSQALANEAQAAPPLARAQDAPAFGTATDRIADTAKNVLGAISFPRFVTDLVNGVFKAMLSSTSQQMQMYVDLLNNVSATAEGFANSQFSLPAIRQWVAEHFPDSVEYDVPHPEPGDDPPDPEDVADIKLRLKPNAHMPGQEEMRAVLGVAPNENVDAENPEQLVPLARRQIARQRQQMLATMVMLGMQRIVIDSGKINASMRFHIDTRSAASEDKGSQFGMQNRVKAGGSFGIGAWGASAEVENTISYVSTQRSQNTEEINTDLDLNSSVELNFRTDYLPLNQMAAQAQADRIRNASLNPSATADTSSAERQARQQGQRAAEESRRAGLTTMPTMPSTPAQPAMPTPNSAAANRPAAPPATAGTNGTASAGASGSSAGTTSGGTAAGQTSATPSATPSAGSNAAAGAGSAQANRSSSGTAAQPQAGGSTAPAANPASANPANRSTPSH